MSEAHRLPPRPNLEQYKKLARDLQQASKSNDPGAVRQWAERWVETLARLHKAAGSITPRERGREVENITQRWNKLRHTTAHAAGCTLAGTQFFIAREHGFKSWPRFARHVQELGRASSRVSAFERAADSIISGDALTLGKLLAKHPGLARERSTREHHSTLLHYVSANGVEDFRQKTPANIVAITNVLLDAGADPDAESEAYGGGCTALGLVATSVHPEQAGVQIALLQTLLDRGARFDQPSAGGNHSAIVHSCIANGQPAAAKFFSDLGAPLDIEGAAALGRVDMLRSYFESDSQQNRPDPKQMVSAFLYACGYGKPAAAEFLLDRGIDPAARNEEGQNGLHWACWGPHVAVIMLLLERGAPIDARDERFNAIPLDMALWTWAQARDERTPERCYEAIALLVQAGSKLDRHHWREPQGEGMLEKIDADPRMVAVLGEDKPH